jgi:hypothetical protein
MSDFPIDRLQAIKNEIKMAETINKEELFPIVQEAVGRYTGEYIPNLWANDWDICLKLENLNILRVENIFLC